MATQQAVIISLHPNQAAPLSFDVRDLLVALGPQADAWIWCVRNLDWLGEGGEDFCLRVAAAGAGGLWLSTRELLDQARPIYQTIEGEFLAFPRDCVSVDAAQLDLCAFPTSQAQFALVAIDGCFFEAYAKDATLLVPLRRFQEVRDEDPAPYFT